MWSFSFKESFRFLFDNPVIFLIILGNFALIFLLGPILGFIGFFFIALLYLIGLHGNPNELWESVKKLVKWAFFAAVVWYILFFGISLVSYFLYSFFGLNLYTKPLETLTFTIIYSFAVSVITHAVYIPLFASTDFKNFLSNLRRIKILFTKGIGAFLLLYGYTLLTFLAGLVGFLHFTVGLYAVISTFWLTYYTFLGVRLFEKFTDREV